MKTTFLMFIVAFGFAVPSFAHDHDASHSTDELRKSFTLSTDVETIKSGPVLLKIQLKNEEGKKLALNDIALSHTQRVHAFLVDQTLTQFRHEHPEWDGKDWILKTHLEKGGKYKLWIQAKIASSGAEVTLSKSIQVQGDLAEKQGFSQRLAGEIDGVVVKLSGTSVKAGEQATLKFDVTRKDGSPLKLESYLGAAAHVVAIDETNSEMAHMHPLNEKAVSPFETHAAFEKPGSYRIWAQFKESGKLLTVPFTLQVANGMPSKTPTDHSKH